MDWYRSGANDGPGGQGLVDPRWVRNIQSSFGILGWGTRNHLAAVVLGDRGVRFFLGAGWT